MFETFNCKRITAFHKIKIERIDFLQKNQNCTI
jgi:hypothetical protein